MIISVRIVQVTEKDLQAMAAGHHDCVFALLKTQVSENATRPSSAVLLAGGSYRILQTKIDALPQWSSSGKSPDIIVPLFEYKFANTAEMLVKFGAQLGATAASLTQPDTEQLFVICSQVFSTPDGKPGYLVYAGVLAH